jgi:hypothetical protein
VHVCVRIRLCVCMAVYEKQMRGALRKGGVQRMREGGDREEKYWGVGERWAVLSMALNAVYSL